LCDGRGCIDWVDNIKLSAYKNLYIPHKKYALANSLDSYFIIDNSWLKEYKGDNILFVCPHCYGLSCGATLRKILGPNQKEKVDMVYFENENKDYELNLLEERDTLIKLPEYYDGPFDWR
jgi:hypothetical protein